MGQNQVRAQAVQREYQQYMAKQRADRNELPVEQHRQQIIGEGYHERGLRERAGYSGPDTGGAGTVDVARVVRVTPAPPGMKPWP